MRSKDNIGTGRWCFLKGNVSSGSFGDGWEDIETDPLTLLAEMEELGMTTPLDAPEYAVYLQWQKVGRSIKQVEVRRIDLRTGEHLPTEGVQVAWV